MEEKAAMLFSRLDKLENLLSKLESNTRADDHEVRPINRKDIDGQQVTVYIRCNIVQVGDIKNVEQMFSSEYYIAARYLEPALKGVKSADDVDWTTQWDPRITFPNAVSIDKMIKKVHFDEKLREDDVPMVVKSFRLIATFKEKLELDDFPVDSQELTLVIKSDWPKTDINLLKDMRIKDSINISQFTDSQTWELVPHVIAGPVDEKKDATGSHRFYPTYHIKCHVVRRVGYYFWNIAFVLFVIMGLTFASFAVPITETGDRLGVTVTMLLTAVAFKFVVSQNLPTISYLTLLDVYVLVCMLIQVLIAIQNSFSSLWSDPLDKNAKLFDTISAAILAGLSILFHVIYGFIILMKVYKRNHMLRRHTKKYNKLCDEINEAYQKRQSNQRDIIPSGDEIVFPKYTRKFSRLEPLERRPTGRQELGRNKVGSCRDLS